MAGSTRSHGLAITVWPWKRNHRIVGLASDLLCTIELGEFSIEMLRDKMLLRKLLGETLAFLKTLEYFSSRIWN